MTSRRSLRLPVIALSITSLFACQRPAATASATQSPVPAPAAAPAPAPRPEPKYPLAPASREADDAGRFLAGLPGTEGSPFAALEQTAAWTQHRTELDEAWRTVETQSLPAMRDFQKAELSEKAIVDAPLFYPFSGPDALMMTVLFPDNPTYLMVALEPPGTIATAKRFAPEKLTGTLGSIRETVYSELHRSFFITREMDKQFRGQVTDGLMPPILLLLVRSGHTILGHRYVQLADDGTIADAKTGPGKNKGVQLDFRRGADGPVQQLFYFSANLEDKYLNANPAMLKFLDRLTGATTMFKSTSYMPHHATFSTIRDKSLKASAAVLQDDSGIPYRFFAAPGWRVQLFGEYTKPYGSFAYMAQPDLRKAYEAPTRKPLAFRIGYGFSKVESNLQFARRN